MKRLLILPFLLAFTTSSPNIEYFYKDYGGKIICPGSKEYDCEHKPPKRNTVHICSGSGCEYTVKFKFNKTDIEFLRHTFATVDSAKEERQRIAKAIAWIEKRVCLTAGTCNDRAGDNSSKVKGQMDCTDEATNTTSYLLIMERYKFLKYHKVLKPTHRYMPMYPHWAASISGYAVDSFFRANGGTPDILLQSRWNNGYNK